MSSRVRLAGQVAAVAVVAALLLLLALNLRDGGSEVPQAVRQGKAVPAPLFTLPRLDGRGELALASLRGKPVIVNFWASWCRPCKDEAPALEQVWRERRDEGLVLVGINYDDLRPDALGFVRETGMSYPLVVDRDKAAVRDYGLTGVPETFFIDRRGRIVGQITGPVDDEDAEERFEQLVERILA